ncbi:MAG: biopolymer transporter ExbD [bacterium]|nr:biopolymer transporter ExbD [bacterium]
MKLQSKTPQKARVEMTPMIDVIFLLLVFFVYSILNMTVQRGIAVELPKATNGQQTERETLRIVLTADDVLLLDGEVEMATETLVHAVKLRYEMLGLPVVIAADRQAHAGPALELMAKLRAAGIQKVVYQIDQETP